VRSCHHRPQSALDLLLFDVLQHVGADDEVDALRQPERV
jgi:hypothetical protein